MTRSMILGASAAAVLVLPATPADAQSRRHSWRTIAYTTVNGRDNDTVRVPGTVRYRQMRLCVYRGPIHMRDLDVRYRNGHRQDVAVRDMMRAGTCTRNIDLRGNRRDVTAVRLKYAPLARGRARPLVQVQVR